MSILARLATNTNLLLTQHVDPRVADWPLISNPLLVIAISLMYFYAVLILGPALMKNRKPYQLKRTLFVYNFLQVLLSLWIFYSIATAGWLTGEYNFTCQPIDTSTSPKAMVMVSAVYWYFLSKFTEFFDTAFFIMRKKYGQVTTLHVVHHGIMPFGCWIGAAITPGGHLTFLPLINTFVHVVMYSYYLLSAFGPSVQKYLWWKKYLTSLQITQFIVVIFQNLYSLFTGCANSKIMSTWVISEAILFLVLFKQFYNQAYKKAPGIQKPSSEIKSS